MKPPKQKKHKLGSYLREIRVKREMSLRDVQKKTGISHAYVSQIEQGKREYPGVNLLRKLAGVYDTPMSTLINILASGKEQRMAFPSPEAMSLARLIDSLSKENQSAILKYVEFLSKKEGKLRK